MNKAVSFHNKIGKSESTTLSLVTTATIALSGIKRKKWILNHVDQTKNMMLLTLTFYQIILKDFIYLLLCRTKCYWTFPMFQNSIHCVFRSKHHRIEARIYYSLNDLNSLHCFPFFYIIHNVCYLYFVRIPKVFASETWLFLQRMLLTLAFFIHVWY